MIIMLQQLFHTLKLFLVAIENINAKGKSGLWKLYLPFEDLML